MLKVDEVGQFVDSVAGNVRTPAAAAGRLLEEVVELGLEAGLSAAQIMAHVADSLHNQSLKVSARQGKTIFPSQVGCESGDVSAECADVLVFLKDLCHVAGVDLDLVERTKWEAFTRKTFHVTSSGVIYAKKPHVVSDTSNS